MNMKAALLACVAMSGVVAPSASASPEVTSSAPGAPGWVAAQDARALGQRVAYRAAAYLRSTQDPDTGLWSITRGGRELPAVTALAVDALLLDPRVGRDDPAVVPGIDAILRYVTPEGGIHDQILPAYNTAICVTTLSRAAVGDPRAASAVRTGTLFLRSLQFGSEQHPLASGGSAMEPVPESHPFYGGVGYGSHGRPDLSNTAIFLEALHAAGVPSDDPAFQRALVFLRRLQMHDRVNEMDYANESSQGGFIYATVPDAESVDSIPGQSQAGEFTETLPDGREVIRLRAYGSMTYAGFKSLLYADLDRDDPRVTLALGWLGEHFTVAENPGMGLQGYYYYLATMARSLDAAGIDTLTDGTGEGRDWRRELIDRLAQLQRPDGSFEVQHNRWMEDQPALVTAYALLALRHALN